MDVNKETTEETPASDDGDGQSDDDKKPEGE